MSAGSPGGFRLQVPQHSFDRLQRRPRIVGNLLGEDARVWQVGPILQAPVAQPEQVQPDFVAGQDLVERVA